MIKYFILALSGLIGTIVATIYWLMNLGMFALQVIPAWAGILLAFWGGVTIFFTARWWVVGMKGLLFPHLENSTIEDFNRLMKLAADAIEDLPDIDGDQDDLKTEMR